MAESKGDKSKQAKSEGEGQYSDEVGTAFIDGLTFRSKPVQYVVVDEMALVEGDINLGNVEDVRRKSDMRAAELSGDAPVAAGVIISGSQFRWPNCTVPYQIDSALPNQNRVTDAIAHWQANTGFNFVLRTSANEGQYPDFVEFVPGNGCSSFVGRQGGRQTITLAAGCSKGNAIHEIGHAVGVWHEQSREDRDAFVTIQWANIIPSTVNNFAQHISDGEDVGPYDYDSIMHYPRTAFSVNGQDTIVPTDPNANIGQRNGLSPGDINTANALCGPQIVTRPTIPTRVFPTRTFPPRTFPPRTFPPRTFPPRTFPPPTHTLPPPLVRPPVFPVRPPLVAPPLTPPPLVRPPLVRPPVFPVRPPLVAPPLTPPPLVRPPLVRPPLVRPPVFPVRPPLVRPPVFPVRPPLVRPPLVRPPFFDVEGAYDPYTGYETGYGGYQDPYTGYETGYEGYQDPYTGYETGYEGYQDPYTGYETGYEGYQDPYTGYETGYGGYQDPYTGYETGYGGYQDPYTGYETGYGGYQDPYTGYETGYGGYQDPYGPAG